VSEEVVEGKVPASLSKVWETRNELLEGKDVVENCWRRGLIEEGRIVVPQRLLRLIAGRAETTAVVARSAR